MKDYFHFSRLGQVINFHHAGLIKPESIVCGYCGDRIAPSMGYEICDEVKTIAKIFQCPQCRHPIIYYVDAEETVPGAMYGRKVKNLPENIEILYDECRTCYANQCYTAAQMVARTILMHTAVAQGAEENKNFAYYVDFLNKQGYIPPNGKEWVDFIRRSGNMANHEITIKGKDETGKIIDFLSMLLMFIYELPNMLVSKA